jgi:hypothetical protein
VDTLGQSHALIRDRACRHNAHWRQTFVARQWIAVMIDDPHQGRKYLRPGRSDHPARDRHLPGIAMARAIGIAMRVDRAKTLI